MHFICPEHAQHLKQKDYQTLSKQWFDWMSKASSHYELGLYQQVMGYCGSSIDISLILLAKSCHSTRVDAVRKCVLACIYLSNALKKNNDYNTAEFYLSSYYEILNKYQQANWQLRMNQELSLSIAALLDQQQHTVYFEDHLNLCITAIAEKPAERSYMH